MKILFTFCGLLIGLHCGMAQYYQSIYGARIDIGSGESTSSTGTGHLMAGNSSSQGNEGIWVTRADQDGVFTTPPSFSQVFLFSDLGGNPLDVKSAVSTEMSNGMGYATLGIYTNPSNNACGLIYMLLDPMGNIMTVQGYLIPVSASTMKVASIYESQNRPGTFYATGHVVSGNEQSELFVLRFNAGGNLVWGNLYDFINGGYEHATDIIESPYGSNIYVTGVIDFPGTGINRNDGFVMDLDPLTGAWNGTERYDYGTMDGIQAIAVSDDPNQPGFVMTGYAGEMGNYTKDLWALKTDAFLQPQWEFIYNDTAIGANLNNYQGIDIIGHLNTSNQYDYFIGLKQEPTGTCLHQPMSIKLEDTGTPYFGCLYTYNHPDSSTYQLPINIDISTDPTDTAYTVYSRHLELYNTRAFVVKSYLNLATACSESISSANEVPMMMNRIPDISPVSAQLTPTPIFPINQFFDSGMQLCYATSVSNGSNLRQHVASEAITSRSEVAPIQIFPNPANRLQGLTLRASAPRAESATVTIVDVMGKNVFTSMVQLQEGENQVALPLAKLNLAQGTYWVTLDRPSGATTQLLVVGE